MSVQSPTNERLAEVILSAFSSPEPEQRGRKRRRSPGPFLTVTTRQIPSGESATFRGRSRHRSVSRIDGSRNTSRLRGWSLSPTRRKLLRIVKINRHRSQSPSRSRSPNTQEPSKRRRQRTRSRSREHTEHTKGGEHLSLLRHEIVIRNEAIEGKQNG
ncbi:uncharacterized protein JN550_001205 [Neoarthrinium moseri]|uniref:uncharacterized protein n=1 Tax=Neoarthrinium moseri TaxID=1658444 RepID=UPI001FDBFF5B|nr:uncharacterized protein JN550_001205 [Neoarthrinium moseri]KAI1877133.1 hypothetical protein JN550_001205 [Neoarthrinium moseri]